ncbi:MAG: glycosyltransferase family 4 protein [Pseudomonadota bacterium]
MAITWQLSPLTGWGKVGFALFDHLRDCGRPPLLLRQPVWDHLSPSLQDACRPLAAVASASVNQLEQTPGAVLDLSPLTVLHSFGNDLACDPTMARVVGSRNVALLAIEEAPRELGPLARMDATIVHSSFTAEMLRGRGAERVFLAFQGVDPELFRPSAPAGRFGGRFVVFSGGKLEFRKGQDLVVAAFARFRRRHPDSLLVCGWASFWPALAYGINEGVLDEPLREGRNGLPDLGRWLVENGVPEESFLLIDRYEPADMAALLAECHAAVFPNRCESATNLVAMEAMATGVPCILSGNTGHLDLIGGDDVLALRRQRPVPDPQANRQGWGESDVEEIEAALEFVYERREEARVLGQQAAARISRWTWPRFAASVMAVVDGEGGGDQGPPGEEGSE